MRSHTLQLYDFHVWANQRVLEHLKGLPKELYHQEIQSVFPSIADVFIHIYATDQTWLSVLSGDSFAEIAETRKQHIENTKGKSLEQIELLFLDLSKKFKAFLESHENLEQAICPEHPHFGKLHTHFYELVQHVVNHGTYHRGNITAMLRQLGYSGIMTDYVAYLYTRNRNE
ncbi:DinB family protein [Bacillus sp. BRMEA1]|uniref:DinB family protein n=1 Tax=Neobacillus endophyticus TaxID=2738405 RepID=UPI0015633703|nr:DinB family protein [Neobacillus endophyticus]NRD80036.1 DinB family protein [Neobacillus endophyticus]